MKKTFLYFFNCSTLHFTVSAILKVRVAWFRIFQTQIEFIARISGGKSSVCILFWITNEKQIRCFSVICQLFFFFWDMTICNIRNWLEPSHPCYPIKNCPMLVNADSGIQETISCGIRNSTLWNPDSRSRNPESRKMNFLESGTHWCGNLKPVRGIWSLHHGIRNPENIWLWNPGSHSLESRSQV